MRRRGHHGLLLLSCALALGLGCGSGTGWEPVAGKDAKAYSLIVPVLHRDETHTVTLKIFSNGAETIPAGFEAMLEVFKDADHAVPHCAPITVIHPTDIASGQIVDVEFQLPIDLATDMGTTLYLVATADSTNIIDEAIETNNTLEVSRPVALERRADLSAQEPFAPDIFRDETNAVVLGVRNDGDKTAPAAFQFTLDVYEDPSYAMPFCAQIVVTCPTDILPGQTVVVEFALPVDITVPEGTWLYLVATIDSLDDVEERDEMDNEVVAEVQVQPERMPDLIVEDIGLPAYMLSDESDDTTYSVTVTVRNADTDFATAPFSVEVVEAIAGWSHTWLVDTDLAAGAEVVLSTTYTVTSDTAMGDRTFTATADTTAAVVERDESNNSSSATCRIEDLDIDLLLIDELPTTIHAGVPFNVRFRVVNIGTVPSPVTDVVPYRVPIEGMIVRFDIIIQQWPAITVAPLQPGESRVYSETLISTESSGFCLILYADFYHALDESYTGNNGALKMYPW